MNKIDSASAPDFPADSVRPIKMPLFFCGLKHCGKSTLGRETADHLNLKFIDADDLIREEISLDPGLSSLTVREFYRKYGKKRFMQIEADAVQNHLLSATAMSSVETGNAPNNRFLYAMGGGACDNELLMQYLKQSGGTVCYIKQAEDVLFERIMKSGIPPFLDNNRPEKSFHELYTRRSTLYSKYADYIFDISGSQPISESVSMILEQYRVAGQEPT